MSRQDNATTERFARTLRELIRRPDNRLCADCKRNDPRWASWNIGVFLCIRCSGIHRGMGTHISRVKSVDLDVWTPEQMDSIQKWGNSRANLYWEAHLKKGHVPPEHKMESFIRSKYESKRWAMEGPPPADPAVLEGASVETVPVAPAPDLVSTPAPAPLRKPVSAQPQPRHALLSASPGFSNRTGAQVQPAPAPAPQKPVDDLFSLDFHSPASSSPPPQSPEQKKDVKQDILSLFSSAPSQSQVAPGFTASHWGQAAPTQQPQQQQWVQSQQTSMAGTSGAGMWGASSGWAPAAPAAPANNLWATPAALQQQQQPNLFASSSDVWGPPLNNASNDPFGSFSSGGAITTRKAAKDDVFGDIWGGFK